MSLIRDRVNEAKKVEAEIKRLSTLQTKRTKSVGESSEAIDKDLKRLRRIRQTLPPKKNAYNVGNDVAFWAGGKLEDAIYTMMNPNAMNPPEGKNPASFVVTHGGTVIANHAIIRGNIYATDGVFSGTVYATDGKFTGDIYSENAYIRGEIHGTSGTFNGKITSNINGNRIEIDPETRTIRMIDKFGSVLVEMGFYDYGGNETGAEIVYKSYDESRNVNSSMRILGGTVNLFYGDAGTPNYYASISHDGKTRFNLDPLQMPSRSDAYYGDVYFDVATESLKLKYLK